MQVCIHAFNQAMEKAHCWLKELVTIGQFDSEEQAYSALRAVLHTLRDRLPINETTHFAAQLPLLIRGMYYDGWKPSSVPNSIRVQNEFIDYVKSYLANTNLTFDVEKAIHAVFHLLSQHISEGEIHHVKSLLSKELVKLWPKSISSGEKKVRNIDEDPGSQITS